MLPDHNLGKRSKRFSVFGSCFLTEENGRNLVVKNMEMTNGNNYISSLSLQNLVTLPFEILQTIKNCRFVKKSKHTVLPREKNECQHVRGFPIWLLKQYYC